MKRSLRRSTPTTTGTFGVALLSLCLGTCGHDGPADPSTLTLGAADEASLLRVARGFAELARTEGPAAARAAMISAAAADPNIADARLGGDGTTVRLAFRGGRVAGIDTTRATGSAPGGGTAALPLSGRWFAREIGLSPECPGKHVPSSKRVKIIDSSFAADPAASIAAIGSIEDHLQSLGWDREADIDEVYWEASDPYALSLSDLLDERGYGLVIYLGDGVTMAGPDDQEHYYMPGIAGGVDSLTEYPARVGTDEYLRWNALAGEGKLAWVYGQGADDEWIGQLAVRDDLIAEELKVDPATTALFASTGSSSIGEELRSAGMSNAFGWQGETSKAEGAAMVERMLTAMVGFESPGEGGESGHDAYIQLASRGEQGLTSASGGVFRESMAGIGDTYLPAWGTFKADSADVPLGTTSVEMTISFPDCPEASLTVTLEPGEELVINGLIPGRIVISSVFRDAHGEVTGRQYRETVVNGGGANLFLLEPCESALDLTMGESPPGTATVRAELVYARPDTPPVDGLDFAVDRPPRWAPLTPGPVVVSTVARDAAGQIVGSATHETLLECGDNALELCFGWADLVASTYPPDTVAMRVSTSSASAPGPVDVALDATTPMLGFAVGEEVTFTAEALDADGRPLGTSSVQATIACGANRVALTFAPYDIVLEVEPTQIAADGVERAIVTATLRMWQPGDVLFPTGAPLAGKRVEFFTTLGDLSGANPVETGADGVAQVALSGTVAGTATVHAVVQADGKDAARVVRIGDFGYFEDFETLQSPIGPEWSHTATMQAGDSSWLGPFRHEEVELRLVGLPPHSRVGVDFDVLIIGFWQGGGCTIYDHPWYSTEGQYMGDIDVAVGTPQLELLYSMADRDVLCCLSFRRGDLYNLPTLCDVERDEPEELVERLSDERSVYHFHAQFQHSNADVTLRFWEDERIVDGLAWYGIEVATPMFAIDNVSVSACSSGSTCP